MPSTTTKPPVKRRSEISYSEAALLDGTLEFFEELEFSDPDARRQLLRVQVKPHKGRRSKPPAGIPVHLAHLWSVPLLGPEEEVVLFRKFNFLKYLVARGRQELRACRGSVRALKQLRKDFIASRRTRDRLVEANLRLVVSLAKRHVHVPSNDFDEFISVGNETLMRAVERFDYRRGFRFSTYAYQAIQRAIFGQMAQNRRHQFAPLYEDQDQLDESVAESPIHPLEVLDNQEQREWLRRVLKTLEPRERRIVIARFGMARGTEPCSFQKIGEQLGLSKQRIRQLFDSSLQKLQSAGAETSFARGVLAEG